MNINRNNYEEYFLLYADNELSPVEKKVVEIFVQENVYLREEFLMIQLTHNSPDEEVKLLDKSFLMKEEPPFIDENNYEENFVLYHDNELSDEQKNETENFVKDHPQFKIEFELIGKAKLITDEAIGFPNKKRLYRKEKSGRVIPLILWRSMAAAVLIGFGLWISVSYFNQKEGIRAIAIDGKTIKSLSTNGQNPILEKPVVTENIAASSEPKTQVIKKENEEVILKRKENSTTQKQNEIATTVVKKNEKKEILPEEKAIPMRNDDRKILAANDPIKDSPGQIITTKSLPITVVQQHVDIEENKPQTEYAQNASYVDNNSSDQNYVFYNVKTDEFNKSKVGGFLKKVKRIVERTNPIARLLSGEDKQVASK